ncbi:family 78 glycoside hydrolase catalytic domain [Tessaracoccus defluvii]|uniref:family 78 glycoside hydrolase catalytic domain n=1 Tax=Tessaracoccus defluvii TaxID=1285901 RepID=UPI003872BFA7
MVWQARMISAGADFAGAPLLRREFSLDERAGRVSRARLTLTALGVVEAWINGRPVSGDLLVPGWTSYEWRLRYADYDVTELVDGPSLVLGLSLGKGWHGGRMGWAPEGSWYGDDIAVLAQLEVTYDDGTQELLITDESWRSGPSAILANDLYDGQTIDARLRDERWKHPGFDDASWLGVRALDFETEKLVPYIGPHVRRWATLSPQSITRSPSGKTLVDFGQNLVGWVKFTATGAPGTEITIRHAEVLENGELGTEPLRSAEATDRYILSGGRDEFEPTFTFHGFRYAEVSGWPGELRTEDLVAVAVGSELKRTGHLTTSNPLLNRLHENVVWGLRGNFLAVPTDCPQRDERLGWTGDISVFAPAAAFLFDVKDFLSDWLIDLALEQKHRDGIAGWVVPDVMKYLPADSVFGVSDSTAIWGDAAVWVPWTLYQAYGDVAVLRRQYESMCSHVRRVERLLSPNGVWDGNFQFGDWLDPDAPPDQPARAKADPAVVATACAYRSATIVAQTAALLGRDSDHAEFGGLAARLKRAFGDVYVHDGVVTSDCSTVYALAIVFGLLSPRTRSRRAEGSRNSRARPTSG